ncbi:MAG: hypothetical protein GZ089_05560 [Aromatoleum sp.]|nr:hypothetical protein [Aromatoleum sp.]
MKLGWIGIGRMGFEMAMWRAKADADVAGWNRIAETDSWMETRV